PLSPPLLAVTVRVSNAVLAFSAVSAVFSLSKAAVTVPIDDSWEGQGRVRIRHVNPTPCTIRAFTPVFDAEP
ncbi:hypothetical protein, partial [Mesorhizobium sp. M4B.F.Ca.ET.203.01.1.1]|uniref:hypothetical protein n=1 Tax=Mesorhizobium sp. M4B.F.Ca.ET.203.01.1.1 TaxID=2563953 RepID=UPI0016719314